MLLADTISPTRLKKENKQRANVNPLLQTLSEFSPSVNRSAWTTTKEPTENHKKVFNSFAYTHVHRARREPKRIFFLFFQLISNEKNAPSVPAQFNQCDFLQHCWCRARRKNASWMEQDITFRRPGTCQPHHASCPFANAKSPRVSFTCNLRRNSY